MNLQAPKKDKAPPPSSKPAKSDGGKQKKKVIASPTLCLSHVCTIPFVRLFLLVMMCECDEFDMNLGEICTSGARESKRRR